MIVVTVFEPNGISIWFRTTFQTTFRTTSRKAILLFLNYSSVEKRHKNIYHIVDFDWHSNQVTFERILYPNIS